MMFWTDIMKQQKNLNQNILRVTSDDPFKILR